MNELIDIHAHWEENDALSIFNLEQDYCKCADYNLCSIGLHPWYLTPVVLNDQLGQLEKYVRFKNVFAIGECGLDKSCQTAWGLQEKAFSSQIELPTKRKSN